MSTVSVEGALASNEESGAAVGVLNQEMNRIYREISKTFQYVLLHYDLLKKLMILHSMSDNNDEDDLTMGDLDRHSVNHFANSSWNAEPKTNDEVFLEIENNLVITLVNLGRATSDVKTMLNSAKSLAHMTEVLHCNETVASPQAMEFMMLMLKDTKNVQNHREGCRYYANLSYYKALINTLIDMKITVYMLGTIEAYS